MQMKEVQRHLQSIHHLKCHHCCPLHIQAMQQSVSISMTVIKTIDKNICTQYQFS